MIDLIPLIRIRFRVIMDVNIHIKILCFEFVI